MNWTRSGILTALAACAAALVAAPAAAAAVDMKISAPKGSDALLEELTLKAKCDEACTIGLNRVQVTNYRGMQQLPGSSEEELKGSKRLRKGQTGTFRIPLGPRVRSQIQSATRAKEAAVVQVVTSLNKAEGPYRSATVRTKSTPKSPLGQDDIVVAPEPKVRSGAPRFRVTIEGVQTTAWHYNRNTVEPDGCHVFARGDGEQTIRFRSKQATVVRYGIRKGTGRPELLAKNGSLPFYPLRLDIERTGKREHGASDECGGDGGGCPGCDDGPQAQCTTRGARDGFEVLLSLSGRNRLWAMPSVGNRRHFAEGQMPDCPIEPFKKAWGDVDLLPANHKFGNPTTHGGGGKVIVILRDKVTDPLDDTGAGTTTTSVRWTVTFRRI